MRHASLFSGIGGPDLAVEWMGWENVFHCEWNEFGQKVLKYYWPKAISYHDIRNTDFTIHRGTIDILTGGFPCQGFSLAGLRLGTDDDRYLWPEMLRAIREIQPRWVVGENVVGLINWGGDWYSTKCSLIWKLRGTKYSRLYFQLVPLMPLIEEIGYGLLHTPRAFHAAMNHEMKDINHKRYRKNDIMNISLLPTPTRSDFNKRGNQPNWDGSDLVSTIHVLTNQPGKTSRLNPRFVMEMMGFPPDWTELPFLNGETKVSKPEETL